MNAFGSLSIAMYKGLMRDRVAIFFTFLFPLLFLVVFGLLFRDGDGSKVDIAVVGNGTAIEALPTDAVDITQYDSWDEAMQAVEDGDEPAAMRQRGDSVELRFAASDQTQAGTVQGLVGGVVNQLNIQATNQKPRYAADFAQVEDSSLKPIQYLTPGILSWGIAISAGFGAALTLVAWRKKRVLRRIRLTPVPTTALVASRLGVSIGVALIQAVLYIGLAMLPAFGLKLSGQWWWSVPLLICGTFAFLSMGLFVGSLAKTEESASAIVNVVVLPMSFLSGVFFPLDDAPSWMQTFSQVLPLRHLVEGLLDVLVRGKGFDAILLPCGVLLAFGIVLGGIAVRLFRWDD